MNMQTNYLGLNLKNPIIVSSNPLSEKLENIKKMERSGAAAIVMHSIFEEEIRYDQEFVDYYMNYGTEKFAESLTFFPNIADQGNFLDNHLIHLEKAVKAVNIPIVGSLNAISRESWIEYALKMQNTGISALEVNLFILSFNGESCELIENHYIDIMRELKATLKIPVSIKLSPYFTSITNIVKKLDKDAAIDGLVLFNRFYHPDFDVKKLETKTNIHLSDPHEALLPLSWIAFFYDKIKASMAGSTGVHSGEDVIKYILAGANAVACTACLLKNGIEHIETLLKYVEEWMNIKKYTSIEQFRGLMSYKNIPNPEEFKRAQYMKALRNFQNDELY